MVPEACNSFSQLWLSLWSNDDHFCISLMAVEPRFWTMWRITADSTVRKSLSCLSDAWRR